MPKKTEKTLADILKDFHPRVRGDDTVIPLRKEGLLIRVRDTEEGEWLPEIPIDLIEDMTDSVVIDSRDGKAITKTIPGRETSDWEVGLGATTRSLVSQADHTMECQECGSYLTVREGDLECAECGLCVNPSCPACNNRMAYSITSGGDTFWACRTKLCGSALKWGTRRAGGEIQEAIGGSDWKEFGEGDEDVALAKQILTHPLIRSSNAAKKLLSLIEDSPEAILPLVLGDKTPSGKPTVQTRLKDKLAAEARRNQKKKRTRKRLKTKKVEKLKTITYYDASDAPEGPRGAALIEVPEDSTRTSPSALYQHHELKHSRLNPIQSEVLELHEKDCNIVVAASTSAGKTLSAEMVMGDALDRGGKAIFLSPLRAVSQEKFDEWRNEDHPWGELGVAICTGDYVMDQAKRKELRRADVIVMTSEMLDSKTRRMSAEENTWLRETLCVVVDEAHLLTMNGRGDALESGLMRFTKNNPHARIVLLSATMPNVNELGSWLSHLNGKPTRIIQSQWRPTKLTVHHEPYDADSGWGSYQKNETSKREAAMRLLQKYPEDKWIVFVHSKKAGHQLLAALRDRHEPAEFHSADLARDKRLTLEDKFRSGNLRVVIATSTLAYGINMPARRVLVLGVHRGIEKVDSIDVKQMFGRAGRVGLDPEGDAYLLLPEDRGRPREFDELKKEFSEVGLIESQLNEVNTLAFHLVAEVAEGDVRTCEDAVRWHSRSLAAQQGRALESQGRYLSAAKVMEDLGRCGILKGDDKGRYEATALGEVASLLYYSPFDVADWASNFRWASERDKHMDDDVVAWALGRVRTAYEKTYLPKEHGGDMGDLEWRLAQVGVNKLQLPPACLSFQGLLTGTKYRGLSSHMRQLEYDVDRIMQAITMIDARVLKGLGKGYCESLTARLRYGCSWQEAELCSIPGVGARRASQLVAAGIGGILDVLDKRREVLEELGSKTGQSVIRGAKEVARRKGLGQWED